MSLGKIKSELYKKDTDEEILHHSQDKFDPVFASDDLAKKNAEHKDVWAEKQSHVILENKTAFGLGLLTIVGIVLVLGSIAGFYKIRQSFFASDRVVVSMNGPVDVKSGNLVTYEIKYKNENRANLKNVKLKLSYPEYFRPEGNPESKVEGTTLSVFDLGSIKGKAEGKISFNGKAYSPKGNLIKIQAELVYTPSTVNTEFTSTDQVPVNIISSPITLGILAPQSVSSGDEINYVINYKNDGATEFSNIRIKVDYPRGFTLTNTEPKTSESNNIWYLGNLSAGQSGKIVVTGRLEGKWDDIGLFNVAIGENNNGTFVSYNVENAETRVAASPLTISQTVNGSREFLVDQGGKLAFEIKYKNEGTIGLRDVIVTEKLDGVILDYAKLNFKGGSYDSSSNTITWKAADYEELKNLGPGQGGIIRFAAEIKDFIPIKSGDDKNFTISSLAKIDSPDVPTPVNSNKIIASNQIELKLNSKLILNIKGAYEDKDIPNTGPIPPKVGEETTLTIRLVATNLFNDVSDAKFEASLPTAVVATGKIFPEGSPLVYNERTNSLVWNIGNMSAGTGITSTAKEVAFQIKIKPSVVQSGQRSALLGDGTFSAKDLFTNKTLSVSPGARDISLLKEGDANRDFNVVD